MGKKKKLYRSRMIPVRLDHEIVKQLDMLALKVNCYRSELIREALQDLFRKHDLFAKHPKPTSAQ